MVFGKDQNPFDKLVKRYKKEKSDRAIENFVGGIVINVLYTLLMEFYKIFYIYMMPIFVLHLHFAFCYVDV